MSSSEAQAGNHVRAHLALVAASFAFGTTFITVKDAVERADPLPFIAARFCVAALVLLPVACWRRKGKRPSSAHQFVRIGGQSLVGAGIVAGAALASGYVLQTVGLQHTSGTVSAFITYLLVIFVALLKTVMTRRLPTVPVTIGVTVATGGLFLLTGARGGFGKGEALTVGCAVAFAIHILVLDRVARHHDPVELTAVQLAVVGLACVIPGAMTGGYRFPAVVWAAVAYTALVASAMAFALQTWAQRRIDPTRTALLLMLEPVFAAILGAVVASDVLGWRGWAGAALVLTGIVVAEFGPLFSRRRFFSRRRRSGSRVTS